MHPCRKIYNGNIEMDLKHKNIFSNFNWSYFYNGNERISQSVDEEGVCLAPRVDTSTNESKSTVVKNNKFRSATISD